MRLMLLLLDPVAKLKCARRELHFVGVSEFKVNMLCLKYTAANLEKCTTFGDVKAYR